MLKARRGGAQDESRRAFGRIVPARRHARLGRAGRLRQELPASAHHALARGARREVLSVHDRGDFIQCAVGGCGALGH